MSSDVENDTIKNPLLNGTAFEVPKPSKLVTAVLNYRAARSAEARAAHNLAEAHRQLQVAQENYDAVDSIMDDATDALLAAAEEND